MNNLILLKCGVDIFLVYYLFIKKKSIDWLNEKYQRRILYFLLLISVVFGLWIYEEGLIRCLLSIIKFFFFFEIDLDISIDSV